MRQRDVLRLVYEGYTSLKIAERLGIAKGTVDLHISKVLRLLGVSSRFEAALIFAECPVCQSTHPIKKKSVSNKMLKASKIKKHSRRGNANE